jgi:hypothetical protein
MFDIVGIDIPCKTNTWRNRQNLIGRVIEQS